MVRMAPKRQRFTARKCGYVRVTVYVNARFLSLQSPDFLARMFLKQLQNMTNRNVFLIKERNNELKKSETN